MRDPRNRRLVWRIDNLIPKIQVRHFSSFYQFLLAKNKLKRFMVLFVRLNFVSLCSLFRNCM